MLNKVDLIGRLGQDPEIKTTNNGKKVARFSLATSYRYNQEEKTSWHTVIMWEKLAEIIEKYVNKGDLIHVSGRIEYRSYDGTDGQKKYITEIVADRMLILNTKQAAPAEAAAPAPQVGPGDDDLPF
jgi:single-strand DNA-binding protein